MAAAAVRTHQQSRVESSHTSLAESKVLMTHASFPSVRLQSPGLTEEMDVSKLIHLAKDHVLNIGTASYFDDDDVHNTTNKSNNILIVIRPSI